MKYTPIR